MHSVRLLLPTDVPDFYPFARLAFVAKALEAQAESIAERVRRHVQAMPAAVFTTNPLWAEARWSATTFQWHPTSAAPPIMGFVFDDAEAGKRLFREAAATNHTDRYDEIRVSIIEGHVPGQEGRPGYSVHISPDREALAAHATMDDFVLDPRIVPFLGQWNRHYPVPAPGMPELLPRFKHEYEKHREYLLAPVVRQADGQLWCEPELGIVKTAIHFRELSDVEAAGADDPDAAALLLPQLVTPA